MCLPRGKGVLISIHLYINSNSNMMGLLFRHRISFCFVFCFAIFFFNFQQTVIRQKPDFGGSGSTSNQSESACQQTNSDFGSSSFGLSPPFCTSGQPAFSANSFPASSAKTTWHFIPLLYQH